MVTYCNEYGGNETRERNRNTQPGDRYPEGAVRSEKAQPKAGGYESSDEEYGDKEGEVSESGHAPAVLGLSRANSATWITTAQDAAANASRYLSTTTLTVVTTFT